MGYVDRIDRQNDMGGDVPGSPKLRDRLRYRFDNYMAKGGRSAFLGLMVVFGLFLAAMLLFRILLSLLLPDQASTSGRNPLRNALLTFVQVFDPGSMEADIDSSGWIVFAAIVAGLGGVLLVSILIAFLTTALDIRLSQLRRGHSQVIESGHTLLLGWEEQRVAEIIRELTIANESERDRAVVVLADRDKEYMDDFISLQVPDTRTTRVVTRSGNPASVINLRLASAGTAQSAIVLAECSDASTPSEKAESDAKAIKTLLALEAEQPSTHSINVVAELFGREPRSMCHSIGIASISALDITGVLARVLVQTSRSVGLSVVYDEIMSFAGSELYLTHHNWNHLTFGEASFMFGDSVPIGITSADGSVHINPDPSLVLLDDDEILILAEDDSTIRFGVNSAHDGRNPRAQSIRLTKGPERQLVIGWGPKAQFLLAEFATYTVEGSSVDIMPRTSSHAIARPEHLEVGVLPLNPLDPDSWATIDPFAYEHIILISEGRDGATPDAIDAETIMILLLLRAAIEREESAASGPRPTVVTELLDSANQVIASKAGVHDFVVSNRIVSMLFAQISEEPAMHSVYESLLSADGSEIYLKPAGLYASDLPTTLSFREIRRMALGRSEVCIGFRLASEEDRPEANFGVHLLPPSDLTVRFSEGDELVVVAENDT